MSTRRYYRTRSEIGHIQIQGLSDTGVPLGTTGLIQRQNLIRNETYSDTGVPVGSTELIQRQELFRYRSTRRYYGTRSDTGVPVDTTELNQRQAYP